MSDLEAVLTNIETNLDAAYERRFALLRIRSISTDRPTQKNVAHSSAPIRATRNCIMLRITCCKQHSDWRK